MIDLINFECLSRHLLRLCRKGPKLVVQNVGKVAHDKTVNSTVTVCMEADPKLAAQLPSPKPLMSHNDLK